jgi:peptidoglycan/xylan/chitin deacetylase (PgdA/CDA1 family)
MKKSLFKIGALFLVIILLGGIIIFLNQNKGYFIFSNPSSNETYVSLRFDDALVSQLSAFELLKEYNYTGSVYVITSKPDSAGWESNYYLNWSQLNELSKFMEIGSHTVTHSDLIYSKNYEYEIVESKKQLEENGFNITSFVYPGGNYNLRVLKTVQANYLCASTQDVGTNWKPIRQYLLKDFTFRKANDISTIKRVIKKGKWNILTFHDIGARNENSMPYLFSLVTNSNSVSLEYFEEVLKYIKQEDIKVITISNGCEKFR